MSARKKVALILQHPAPYRDDFARQICASDSFDADLFSLFPCDNSHDFSREGVNGVTDGMHVIAARSDCGLVILCRLLRLVVFSRRFDFIMWPGYNRWYVRVAIFLCAMLHMKYGFTADTAKQKPMGKLAFALKHFFVRRASLILVVGHAGRKVFEDVFKVDSNKIVEGAYALDGELIEKKILTLRGAQKCAIRKKLGIKEDSVLFLMVANMIRTRHYPITSEAFVKFAKDNPNCYFLMVGKGPETDAMIQYAERNQCLKVIPGCSFEEMLSLYAAADVYVHGGTEPASTALVIGAIGHLPLVSSPAVGCYFDVVRDGDTGFAVSDYLAIEQWTVAFRRALLRRNKWPEMGALSRELSRRLDVGVVVQNCIASISSIIGV